MAALLCFCLSCVEPFSSALFCFVFVFGFTHCFCSIVASCILSHCCAIRFDLGVRGIALLCFSFNRRACMTKSLGGRRMEFLTWVFHIQSLVLNTLVAEKRGYLHG